MADFVAEFSSQVVSLEQACLASTHEERKNSYPGSFEIQLVSGVPEVVQEPPQDDETMAIDETSRGLEVLEPPQIYPTMAWKMFLAQVELYRWGRGRGRNSLKKLRKSDF